jgi:uncharacterized protein
MKNIKYLSVVFAILFLIFGFIVNAQNSNTSIFWKISGNGLTKPSYLYGSIHMIAQKDFFLLDSLEEIFNSCDEIILEVDMDEPDFMQRTQQLMFMPNNSISDFLDVREYQLLDDFFKDSLNLSLVQFQNIKPFFLTQFIIPKIINEPISSYEMTFLQMAKNQQKELTGLESIEEQMGSLDKIPFDKQATLVLESIIEFNESREIYSKLIESYKNKDFIELYDLLFESSKELEEFEQLLLIDRNKKWIPQIENKINKKSCFIAVGALHLEGKNGLVKLLVLLQI